MFKKSVVRVLTASLLSGVAPGFAADSFAKEIRWGTSRVDSIGHRAVTALVRVVAEAVPGYNFSVQPTSGAILTVKGYAIGDFEGYYGSDVAFYELANNAGRFEGFREKMQREPVQSFWTYTVEVGVGIHARNMHRITKWSDLHGMRVFTGPRPWDNRAHLERAFSVLGIEYEYIDAGIRGAGSLLEQGRIAALGVYTSTEAATPGWLLRASLQTDWVPLSPDAGELEKLAAAGFKVVEVETAAFGKTMTRVSMPAMVRPLHRAAPRHGRPGGGPVPDSAGGRGERGRARHGRTGVQADSGGHGPYAASRRRGGGPPGAGAPWPRAVHARAGRVGREVGFAYRPAQRPVTRHGERVPSRACSPSSRFPDRDR